MRPTSKQVKDRILRGLFNGDSYAIVAEREGRSTSTVKVVFDEFVTEAEGSSLEETAQEYSVSDQIDVLRDIAVQAKKADLSWPELLQAVRLARLIKKLKLYPVDLENILKTIQKHEKKFGEFIGTSLYMSRLEEETGKTYTQLQTDYESTSKIVETLKQTRKSLESDIETKRETARKDLERLTQKSVEAQEESAKAQLTLYALEATKTALKKHGLDPTDYGTVNRFLNEINNLGSDPRKAVGALKQASSLDAYVHNKRAELESLGRLVKIEKDSIISARRKFDDEAEAKRAEIETLKQTLGNLSVQKETEEQEFRRQKETEEQEIRNLRELRTATEMQVDGLLKRQAAMLSVQPDIDLVSEAIPKRKEELLSLDKQVAEKKDFIGQSQAFNDLLEGRPSDRTAIIELLKGAHGQKNFGPLDDAVRRRLVNIMAQHGYVPKLDYVLLKKEFEEKLRKSQEETETWHRIAKTRLEELETCRGQLEKERAEYDKKLDESISKKVANIAAELVQR